MNIRQNPGIPAPGILGQPNPEIPGLEKTGRGCIPYMAWTLKIFDVYKSLLVFGIVVDKFSDYCATLNMLKLEQET